MKGLDIANHFASIAYWVDSRATVDGVTVGDPEKEVATILVTWISSFSAVRAAVEGGFDMLITHEPTFYTNQDPKEHPIDDKIGLEKMQYIAEHGLVILRNHDCWDRMPRIGVPWAWAQFLYLGVEPVIQSEHLFLHRYDVAPTSFEEFATQVAQRTAESGEPTIQVVGDGTLQVSKVGIGTGCFCDTRDYRQMGCDVGIVCDDGTNYWSSLQRDEDDGFPVIRVNHSTAEDPAMKTLATYCDETFEGVSATYLPHKCAYRLVGA